MDEEQFARKSAALERMVCDLTALPLNEIQKAPWKFHKNAFELMEDATALKSSAETALLDGTRADAGPETLHRLANQFAVAEGVHRSAVVMFECFEQLKNKGWK